MEYTSSATNGICILTSLSLSQHAKPNRRQREHGRKSLHFVLAVLQEVHEFSVLDLLAILRTRCRSLELTRSSSCAFHIGNGFTGFIIYLCNLYN